MQQIKRKVETKKKSTENLDKIGYSSNGVLSLFFSLDKKETQTVLNFDEKETHKILNFISKLNLR